MAYRQMRRTESTPRWMSVLHIRMCSTRSDKASLPRLSAAPNPGFEGRWMMRTPGAARVTAVGPVLMITISRRGSALRAPANLRAPLGSRYSTIRTPRRLASWLADVDVQDCASFGSTTSRRRVSVNAAQWSAPTEALRRTRCRVFAPPKRRCPAQTQ